MSAVAGSPAARPPAPGTPGTLLPRTGGPPWPATVRAWEAPGATVLVTLDVPEPAVQALDHHQVWLSTVGHDSAGAGTVVFVGRARAGDRGGLLVDRVVRMVDEPRRSAVRAAHGTVTLLPQGAPERTVHCLDLSRGGVRLPIEPSAWRYADPVELVVHLDNGHVVNAVGRLHRRDVEWLTVVLRLDPLPGPDGGELDRYALSRLRRAQARATRSA